MGSVLLIERDLISMYWAFDSCILGIVSVNVAFHDIQKSVRTDSRLFHYHSFGRESWNI